MTTGVLVLPLFQRVRRLRNFPVLYLRSSGRVTTPILPEPRGGVGRDNERHGDTGDPGPSSGCQVGRYVYECNHINIDDNHRSL